MEPVNCSWNIGFAPVQTFLTCVGCLAVVSGMRETLCLVIKACHRPVSEALLFPAWEGPVVLIQVLALVEAAFEGISTGCSSWITVGFLILAVGPLAFLFLSVWRVCTHVKTGDLFYVKAPRPTWAQLRASLSEAKGCWGQMKALQSFYEQWRAKGEWRIDNPHARHWGFLLGDTTGFGFVYVFFLLIKKIYIAAVMELADGQLNAALSLAMQTLDSVLLLVMRPYNDSQVTFTEAFAVS